MRVEPDDPRAAGAEGGDRSDGHAAIPGEHDGDVAGFERRAHALRHQSHELEPYPVLARKGARRLDALDADVVLRLAQHPRELRRERVGPRTHAPGAEA